MEKPKRKSPPNIHFVAPMSLEDCRWYLKGQEKLDFLGQGIEVSFEAQDASTYSFRLRRMIRGDRYRGYKRWSSGEVTGYLKYHGENETEVIANTNKVSFDEALRLAVGGLIFFIACILGYFVLNPSLSVQGVCIAISVWGVITFFVLLAGLMADSMNRRILSQLVVDTLSRPLTEKDVSRPKVENEYLDRNE